MEKVKYIRVSTTGQNTDRQHSEYKMYIDKVSGTVPFNERPMANKLLVDIDKGLVSELIVHSIDRLGRNTLDVLQTIDYLKNKGVIITIENIGVSSMIDNKVNPIFDLIVNVSATLSQMEKAYLDERRTEGIEQAKKKGVYKGREKGTVESTEQLEVKYKDVVRDIRKNKFSYSELQKMHNITRPTVAKLIKLFKVVA